MQYKHTQNGILIKIMMGGAIVLCLIIAGIIGLQNLASYSLYGVAFIFILLTWLFGSLTIEVTDEELKHWFGPGFWKKSYQLLDIESATQVRNSWIFGWGIRITPHGWLYNVSGLDAIQIQLRSGRKFRIGTDDPLGVLGTISQKIP